MLRITQSESAVGSTNYHMSGITQAAYYTDTGPATWKGKGAERLGLAGMAVTKKGFGSLADGYDPLSGKKLFLRKRANRIPGYDFTFNVSKSVSLLWMHTGDNRIMEAMSQCAELTMDRDVQKGIQTRDYDENGKGICPRTKNLIYSGWPDYESRPGSDGIPDPHLHYHAYAFMPTWNEARDRWQTANYGGVKSYAFYYEAAFLSRLAQKLKRLGYNITPTRGGKSFEITGISRRLIKKFSRRTEEIQAEAEKLGITHHKALDALGAKTRRRKNKNPRSRQALFTYWLSLLTPDEIVALEKAGTAQTTDQPMSAGEALSRALAKCLERSSVVEHKRLLTEALRFGLGHVLPEDIQAAFERMRETGELTGRETYGRFYVTTPEVAAEETAMLEAVRSTADTCDPLKVTPHIFTPVMNEDGSTFELSDEQQEAVRAILGAKDRIMSLRGVAGAGKTTALQELVSAIQTPVSSHPLPEGVIENGNWHPKTVFTVAPSSDAVGVLRQEGFAEAATLQSLLISKKRQAKLKGGVLLVDEAGLVSVRQMRQVFDIAEQQDARVILVGDDYQHTAVERSDVNVLRILRQHAGLDTAAITRIQRQNDPFYRFAVQALSEGDIKSGFNRLDGMGAVREIKDDAGRYGRLADDYLAITGKKKRPGLRRKPKTALIVAPTHKEGEDVTAVVRARLKTAYALGQEEHDVERLRGLGWTGAERGHAASYEPGMIIQFVRQGGRFQSGDRLTVTGRNAQGRVTATDRRGQDAVLPLNHADRFQVYRESKLSLAVGDIVRIAQNGFDRNGHRLTNGTRHTVEGFTPEGHIRLEGGQLIDRDFGHLDHGYCLTSHAAQGKTVDHVLIAESAVSFAAAGPDQFYVSASRGREGITVYTDDKEALRDAVARSPLALSVADLVKREDEERERRIRVYDHLMSFCDFTTFPAIWPSGKLGQLWDKTAFRVRHALETLRHALPKAPPAPCPRPSGPWRPAT